MPLMYSSASGKSATTAQRGNKMAAELGDTILGTEKMLSMKQVVVGKGGVGESVLGPTILGTEKVLSMKQVVVGEGKN